MYKEMALGIVAEYYLLGGLSQMKKGSSVASIVQESISHLEEN